MATHGLPAWPLIGQQADALPEAERLLLDALRGWCAAGAAGPLGTAAIILAAGGVEALALPLDAALRELPGIEAAAPLGPQVTGDEAAMLHAVAALQASRRSLALALLHRLAPPLQAYRALPALMGVACGLRRARLLLALTL